MFLAGWECQAAEALALNRLLAGSDAHAKNYSLLLSGTQVRLAPLYDVGERVALPGLPRPHVRDGHEARWHLPGRTSRPDHPVPGFSHTRVVAPRVAVLPAPAWR